MEELRSVARQVERSREYAARKGWHLRDDLIFVDDGISGFEFERRPGLQKLLGAVEAKAFDVLIMSEPSRLGREQTETNSLLKRFYDAGIEVWYYLDDRQARLDNATGKLIEGLHSYVSESERESGRKRTLDGMLRRARAGYSTGGAVYGYESFPVYHSGRQDPHGQPIPDYVDRRKVPEEASVIQGIFKMRAAGYGHTAIAKTLNGSPGREAELAEYFGGVRPPSPRPGTGSWAGTAVREMLRRPLYIGKVVWGRSRRDGTARGRNGHREPPITVDRPDLRIIDQELWEAVQSFNRERSTAYLSRTGGQLYGRPARSRDAKYVLSGTLQCGVCGGAMVVGKRIYKPRTQSYYTCSYHVKRGSTICPNAICVPIEELDHALLGGIETAVLSPTALSYLLEKAAEAVRRSLAEDPGRLEALRRQRADIERKISRLVNAVMEADSRPRSLVEAIKTQEEDRERVDQEIAAAEHRAHLA